METNCTSLATSKRLKAAGFPQKTVNVWEWSAGIPAGEAYLWQPEMMRRYGLWGSQDVKESVAAPTSTELYLASNKDPRCNLAMPEDAARAWLAINNKGTSE